MSARARSVRLRLPRADSEACNLGARYSCRPDLLEAGQLGGAVICPGPVAAEVAGKTNLAVGKALGALDAEPLDMILGEAGRPEGGWATLFRPAASSVPNDGRLIVEQVLQPEKILRAGHVAKR